MEKNFGEWLYYVDMRQGKYRHKGLLWSISGTADFRYVVNGYKNVLSKKNSIKFITTKNDIFSCVRSVKVETPKINFHRTNKNKFSITSYNDWLL